MHSPKSSRTFPGIFLNTPRNLLEHSPEYEYKNIARNPSEHSLRSLHFPHSVPRFFIPGFMNSLKKDVAGANFALVSCNICIIKANLVYIDRHLLTRNLNK